MGFIIPRKREYQEIPPNQAEITMRKIQGGKISDISQVAEKMTTEEDKRKLSSLSREEILKNLTPNEAAVISTVPPEMMEMIWQALGVNP